jgi:RHS repeat-associated protein
MTVKKYRYAKNLSGGMTYYVPVDGENQYYQNEYYYRKNIQGDVTHIFDENLNLVAKYEYDAWGNHTVTNYTDDNIGDLNPIRYRSYYFDSETGLFYLKSRYYDPDTGRFINADDPSVLNLTSGDINGFNLYVYCGNNPISRVDYAGNFWDYVFDAVFIAWGIYDLVENEGYKDWKNWVALGVDIVFAVIPFIPSGAGQVIKIGNKIDNIHDITSAINKLDNIHDLSKITVIGQSMNRVQDAAKAFNAIDNIYDGFKSYNKMADMGKMGKVGAEIIGKGQNAAWLFSKLRKGYTVIDIGVDTVKVAKGIVSSSYVMERFLLMLWKTRNIWKLPVNYYF